MATTTKLITKYKKANGESVTQTLRNVKNNVTADKVKTYVNTVVENGSIFTKVPVSVSSAVIQTIEETEVDLS